MILSSEDFAEITSAWRDASDMMSCVPSHLSTEMVPTLPRAWALVPLLLTTSKPAMTESKTMLTRLQPSTVIWFTLPLTWTVQFSHRYTYTVSLMEALSTTMALSFLKYSTSHFLPSRALRAGLEEDGAEEALGVGAWALACLEAGGGASPLSPFFTCRRPEVTADPLLSSEKTADMPAPPLGSGGGEVLRGGGGGGGGGAPLLGALEELPLWWEWEPLL
mmetsp:Transcript_26218/g.87850  ORF Transcript_26218/g.87850 Transcript_26218/m.87850 type:complete len:220 (-) Transcript_26218:841-1500(-)